MLSNRVGRKVAAYVGIVAITMAVLISTASVADARARNVHAKGDLIRYDNPYGDGRVNPIPEGARASVRAHSHKGRTTVTLHVHGLPPNREFGAHAHKLGCALPDKAGGHYQNDPDPTPTTPDPAYANPENEVWLDFTTDAKGNGSAKAKVDWTFRPDGANAVIIHDHHTDTVDGSAGTAGSKLACLDVDF